MDLISRAWLKEAIHNFFNGLTHEVTEEDIQRYIDVAPSAFEGMTNGEVIKALFPQIEPRVSGSTVEISNDKFYILASKEFWNSPYQKGGSE